MKISHILIGLLVLAAGVVSIPLVMAETTVPQNVIYNGHLLDSSGNAITAEHSIRFSHWTNTDYVAGDVTATGAINIGAANYASWNEVHTVTPNSDGYFSVELGSNTALPDFSSLSVTTLLNLHLQVEVKTSAAADTSYELLDRNTADDTVDRSPIRSVPFSLNADLLDRRAVGTGSGSIPHLGSGGSLLQAGTIADQFTIDADGSSGSTIHLNFGKDLGKRLTYDQDAIRFNFNADLRVEGGLTIGNHEPSSGTGAGTLRWTGTDFEGYDGTNWKNLSEGGGMVVGVTTASSTGSFVSGSVTGYQAGNALCSAQFSGSHMCQADEVITTISSDITKLNGISNAWVAEGAPGYTSDSNDCKGWSSGSGSHLGAWWEFSTDGGSNIASGGGQGYLTSCATNQPIACCR